MRNAIGNYLGQKRRTFDKACALAEISSFAEGYALAELTVAAQQALRRTLIDVQDYPRLRWRIASMSCRQALDKKSSRHIARSLWRSQNTGTGRNPRTPAAV